MTGSRLAPPAYKRMIVSASLDDIVLSRALTGLETKDVWSAGHTFASVHDVPPAATLIDRIAAEYAVEG